MRRRSFLSFVLISSMSLPFAAFSDLKIKEGQKNLEHVENYNTSNSDNILYNLKFKVEYRRETRKLKRDYLLEEVVERSSIEKSREIVRPKYFSIRLWP